MRSDYALYGVAVIFFILTGIALAYQVEPREVWIVSTVVLGLFFLGLGYYLRPKPEKLTTAAIATSTPTTVEVTPSQVVQETVERPAPITKDLTEVKGIGEKRAAQLKSIGINTVEELAKASAEDLASKLKVSQKITRVWIENAKKLIEEF